MRPVAGTTSISDQPFESFRFWMGKSIRLASFYALTSFLIFPACYAYLLTDGKHLLNATTGKRVRLRCVNWYGAHQEPLVPGGLEVTSIDTIVNLIIKVGANCVRIPLSDMTVLKNPIVEARFDFGVNFTAMQVLDSVVSSLTTKGLMVILNSHTSRSGWVGLDGNLEEAPQGLWHGPNISTSDWVQALSSLAERYASNNLMVGIDLRNEIHDQNQIIVTWGETDNVDSDWLAAATLADQAISSVNPNALIIVSGLCRAYDLRPMVDRPGPQAALKRRKLMYTTHVYTFSWWWTQVNLLPVLEAAIAGLLLSGVALITIPTRLTGYSCEFRKERPHEHAYNRIVSESTNMNLRKVPLKYKLMAGAASFFPFACLWIVIAYVKAFVAGGVGCSTIASESEPWLVAGICLFILSAGCLVLSCKAILKGRRELCRPIFVAVLVWIFLASASVCSMYWVTSTYWMVLFDLSRWCLEDRSIPVWVGEFGTTIGDNSWKWGFLTRVLRDYELDFAYWAINGRKWRHGNWELENYGLFTEDYTAVRNQSFADDLFKP